MKKALFLLPLALSLMTSCSNISSTSSSIPYPPISTDSSNGSSTESESTTSATESYTFEFSSVGDGGTATANVKNGTYDKGITISLTATITTVNGIFDGYYFGDKLISKDLTYAFELTKDTKIEARFHLGENLDDYVYQTFSHKFNQNDFTGSGYNTTAGSKEINGLTWNYDAFTFLGQSSDGVQIGSNKAPQKTPWVLSTDFGEEVYLTSISISGLYKNPTSFTISNGDFGFAESLQNTSYSTFEFENLNAKVSGLNIGLSVQSKALYLDTLTFTILVPKDSDLTLTTDISSLEPAVPGKNGVPETKYQPITSEEYYSDVDLTLDGDALKLELYSKISNLNRWSYGDDTEILLYVDANPEDPKYLYGIYDGDDIVAAANGVWNKEHVWACAQMGLGGDKRPDSSTKNRSSDLHNLRVSCQNSNGDHGNLFFDNTDTTTTFFPNIAGEPNDAHNYAGDHRGDVARILFYMATCYQDVIHLDDNLNANDDYSMGKLSTLLEWNEADPVDAFEIQRNNRIYEYQGNRNPFIDHPELAARIW